MASGSGRGQHGLVSKKEAPHCNHNSQEAMITNLQRQIVELTQRLEAQNVDDQMYDHDSDESFENLYHNCAPLWECHGSEDGGGDLGFKVFLLEFSSTLQVEGFIDWLHELECIFDYKDVPDRTKVKLVTIKLKGQASAW